MYYGSEWNIFDETNLELLESSLDDTFLNDVQSKLKLYLKSFREKDGKIEDVNNPDL